LLWVFSQERDLFVCLSGVTRIQLWSYGTSIVKTRIF
jgi:hypothetical protein